MAFPSLAGTANWVLELDIADDKFNPKGSKMISFELVSAATEANAVTYADSLIDAIEALQPAGAIQAARLVKPKIAVETPVAEVNNQERILVTMQTASGNSSHSIPAPAKVTASGTLVSDGVLHATNTEFIALITILNNTTWAAQNGDSVTGFSGGRYDYKPGAYQTGSRYS